VIAVGPDDAPVYPVPDVLRRFRPGHPVPDQFIVFADLTETANSHTVMLVAQFADVEAEIFYLLRRKWFIAGVARVGWLMSAHWSVSSMYSRIHAAATGATMASP
jgi:hypothetical protein